MTVAQRPAGEITMGPRRERYLLDSERLLGPLQALLVDG